MNPSAPTTAQFLNLIRRQHWGRLKIYLGYAPGVGKTYEMLQEGQRLRRLGIDVVTGIVETYGRAEVAAQVADLEQVPRKRIPFRDLVWEQLDLDAVLARRPAVVLVDELARMNAPDSRNASRSRDVEELLRAGIHVISTLDLQYLEGVENTVEQVPGVRVKGRVPEHVVSMADQLVSVDPPPETLHDRYLSGKIYPLEEGGESLHTFLTLENLARLRERARTVIARLTTQQRRKSSQVSPSGSERILVCLSSKSPNAVQLLRKGAELADRLNVPWYVVHIHAHEEAQERADQMNGPHRDDLSGTLTLAKQLEGIPLILKSSDLVGAIAAVVAEYGITHVLLGRSRRPWYYGWFRQPLLDRLLRALRGVDVIVANDP